MIKRIMIEKAFNFIIVLFLIFVISLSVYSHMTFKIETDSLKESFDIVKDSLTSAGLYDILNGKADKIFAIAIAQVIAFIISSISLLFLLWYVFRLYSLEKQSAYIDVLTEVYNRRAMRAVLEHELGRAKKFKHPISLAIIDIDYFKQYNDLFGHLRGDSALHKIARILKKNVREIDIVGRIGGEEFLVIFPETDMEGAYNACEKLRKEIEKSSFRGERKLPNRTLSVSIGISGYDYAIHGNIKVKEETLIDEADKKLYEAKHLGRNLVRL